MLNCVKYYEKRVAAQMATATRFLFIIFYRFLPKALAGCENQDPAKNPAPAKNQVPLRNQTPLR